MQAVTAEAARTGYSRFWEQMRVAGLVSLKLTIRFAPTAHRSNAARVTRTAYADGIEATHTTC